MARGGPCHIMVFPNLMLLWDAVRVIQPISLARTHIYYHPALLKGTPDAVNIARIRAQEGGFGPAGFLVWEALIYSAIPAAQGRAAKESVAGARLCRAIIAQQRSACQVCPGDRRRELQG